MKYRVSWWPLAEERLSALWKAAADPEVVADAADAVNHLLAADPMSLGESRVDDFHRLWFQRPLCVIYLVDTANRAVYVAAVEWMGM